MKCNIKNDKLSWTSLLLISLMGCISVYTRKPDGTNLVMSTDEFAQYAEYAFRHHNRVMSVLIDRENDTIGSADDLPKPLKMAEDKMIQTCLPLNEVVSDEMSGIHVDIKTRLELLEAVPACEAATLQVENLLH